MRTHCCICFIVFSFSIIFAQDYQPYTFTNFEPEWRHLSYEPSLQNTDIKGYFLEDWVVQDDAIYLSYSLISNLYFYNGFLLEKINLKTGELIWNQIYIQPSFLNRESPSKITLKDDNSLVLSSFRQINEDDSNYLWYAAQMSHWIFDTDTGNVLDTIRTVNNDTLHVDMYMNFNAAASNLARSRLYESDNTYHYLQSTIETTAFVKIIKHKLDSKGHAVNSYEKLLPTIDAAQIVESRTIPFSDEQWFNYRKSENPNNPSDSFNIVVTMLDSNLNILYEKIITEDFTANPFHFLSSVGNSTFSIIEVGDLIFADQFDRYLTMNHYDYEGNLIQRIALNKEDGTPICSDNGLNILHIDDLKETLLVAYKQTETESYFEWYLLPEGGEIETLGKTWLTNPYDRMSWDFFPDAYMRYLGNGKILLHTLHLSDDNSNNLSGTRIPNILMFSIDDIREAVNIKIIEDDPTLIVYPMPVSKELQIKNNSLSYANYEIIDVSGKQIQTGNITNNPINVQQIPNGYYTLKLLDTNAQITTRKFIKHQ